MSTYKNHKNSPYGNQNKKKCLYKSIENKYSRDLEYQNHMLVSSFNPTHSIFFLCDLFVKTIPALEFLDIQHNHTTSYSNTTTMHIQSKYIQYCVHK